jgi:hypothetical protein
LDFRWRIDGDDIPMAYPYVEFQRGLPVEIEPIDWPEGPVMASSSVRKYLHENIHVHERRGVS